jgi:hypothetical protein
MPDGTTHPHAQDQTVVNVSFIEFYSHPVTYHVDKNSDMV